MMRAISCFRGRRHGSGLLLALMILLISLGTASAGTVCGTLIDNSSGLPVAGAGVFARFPAGGYAGSLAVSDASGAWCIDNLEPGTYTLEVRVDDYLTVYRNDIEVTGDVVSIPISLQRPNVRLDPLWPNPATSGMNMRLHVNDATAIDLDIYDQRGRLLRSWSAGSVGSGSHEYWWDGRDSNGRDAPSGLYFVRLRSRDMQTTRPLVLSR